MGRLSEGRALNPFQSLIQHPFLGNEMLIRARRVQAQERGGR